MASYHAVMMDETGCEFGVTFDAESRDDAYRQLSDDYPESSVVQLEDNEQQRQREMDVYQRAMSMYDDPFLDDFDY